MHISVEFRTRPINRPKLRENFGQYEKVEYSMTQLLIPDNQRLKTFVERRQALIEEIDGLLKQIKTAELAGMVEGIAVLISHPQDFELPEELSRFNYLIIEPGVSVTSLGLCDLIVYRQRDLSHDVAFGFFNGAYIDRKKTAAQCMRMRSIRFATVMLPDTRHVEENQDEVFSPMEQMVVALKSLVAA